MVTPTNGFAQKALIITIGAILSVLTIFFVWLAIAIVEIRVNVAGMKGTVASLVETRAQENSPPTNSNIERNTRRIEQLEGAR